MQHIMFFPSTFGNVLNNLLKQDVDQTKSSLKFCTGPVRDKINLVILLFTAVSHVSLQIVTILQKIWMNAAVPNNNTFTVNIIVKQTGQQKILKGFISDINSVSSPS